MQKNNDPKYTVVATDDLLKANKWDILLREGQSPDLNPGDLFLKYKQAATEVGYMKTCQNISRDDSRLLEISMGSRMQAVIDQK